MAQYDVINPNLPIKKTTDKAASIGKTMTQTLDGASTQNAASRGLFDNGGYKSKLDNVGKR